MPRLFLFQKNKGFSVGKTTYGDVVVYRHVWRSSMSIKLKKDKRLDVFQAYLVEGAEFRGEFEMPLVGNTDTTPDLMVPFSIAMSKKHAPKHPEKYFIHFFESDYKFIAFVRNPKRYLRRLKQYAGLVAPDLSIYYDLPRALKPSQVYYARALTYFCQQNGLTVIPLVRFDKDEFSYKFLFDGIENPGCTFVSPYGCQGEPGSREAFYNGLKKMIDWLHPKTLLFFGIMPDDMKAYCGMKKIKVVEYNIKKRGDKISTRITNDGDITDLPLFAK